MLKEGAFVLSCLLLLADASAQAQQSTATRIAEDPYARYEFLIGVWATSGGITQRFEWGPERSYILYSTTIAGAAGAEHMHFEGMLIFNASTRNLDFLIAVEPGSFAQEQGTLHVEPDGSVVRDVTLINPSGAMARFRQTFRTTGANAAVTSLMRQTPSGSWEPNFPGSDNLTMERRVP